MTKRCCRCKRTRSTDEFYANKGRPDNLQTVCKRCQAKRRKKYHAKDRKEDRARRRAYIAGNCRRLMEYLSTRGCADCPERDPIVLEFDHVRGQKRAHVSSLVTQSYSWKTILREIQKCVVRCANCHRRRTARTRGWFRAGLAAVDQLEDRLPVEQKVAGASPVSRVS